MKTYVRRQAPIHVEPTDNSGDLAGLLRVTEDGVTRTVTPEEFNARYKEAVVTYPGRIAYESKWGQQPGCKAVGLLAASTIDLAKQLNEWAERDENRGLIMRDLTVIPDPDHSNAEGVQAFFLVMAGLDEETMEILQDKEVHEEATRIVEERRAAKREKDKNIVEEQKRLYAAKAAADAATAKEREELIADGKAHRANCKKKGKK